MNSNATNSSRLADLQSNIRSQTGRSQTGRSRARRSRVGKAQAGTSQTGRSSASRSSHQLASQRARPRNRTHAQAGLPEEIEYQFHETPLGLFESYFADSQQHHGSLGRGNNPGIVLDDSSEASEAESSYGEGGDVTVVNQGDQDVSGSAQGNERATLQDDHPEPTTTIAWWPKQANIDLEENGALTANTTFPANQSTDDAEDALEASETPENDVSTERPAFIPDDDLFKARWYPDPYDRPPHQMWSKDVQDQHNLTAAIKTRRFTGQLGSWFFNQLCKRKGYRFPYKERTSLKRPNQTHADYLAALRQRREEEHSYENQVKEYDEEKALEECQWALNLYNKVYGPEWPEGEATTKSSESNTAADQDVVDGDHEEEETGPTRRRTHQHTSTPEPPKTRWVTDHDPGLTMPPPDQRASAEQTSKSNKAFRIHKKRVMKAARKEREDRDLKYFLPSAGEQRFSNGYKIRIGDRSAAQPA